VARDPPLSPRPKDSVRIGYTGIVNHREFRRESRRIESRGLTRVRTHLRGAQIVLRSKTPDLIRQEFFGLLMAHFAVRGLMHEAALKADEDPDRISFLHSVHVVQRRMARYAAIPPSAEKSLPRSDPR
jgi:hypothetical protein